MKPLMTIKIMNTDHNAFQRFWARYVVSKLLMLGAIDISFGKCTHGEREMCFESNCPHRLEWYR